MKEPIRGYKPEITILQEAKLTGVNIDIITGLCSFENPGWIALPSVRVAGGVLLIWNSELVEVEFSWVDYFSVIVLAAFAGDSQKWLVTGVYGPSVGGQLFEDFINELDEIRGRKELLWCIGGDFNEVLFINERNKATRRTRGMDSFGDFVDRNELIDVPLLGVHFT